MALVASVTAQSALGLISNRRVRQIRPLIPAQILLEEIPLTLQTAQTVIDGRAAIEAIIRNEDDRLIVVVGPSSVHSVEAAREYAEMLKAYADTAKEDLVIVMRVSFERPRSDAWRGLINDPDMNGTSQVNKGLHLARSLLSALAEIGLPAGCEWLDTITPQYTADLVSWGAIGARTTESQVHRELTSGLSMPVGFKNSTDGTVSICVDACKAAISGHCFLTVGREGLSSIVESEGNPDVHVILRGGTKGPNYEEEHVSSLIAKLQKAGLPQKVMIDCSHGNSGKVPEKQAVVAENIAQQIQSGSTSLAIFGVMLESNLVEGRQDIGPAGVAGLKYGQSLTDACIGFDDTIAILDKLRKAVQVRRQNSQKA